MSDDITSILGTLSLQDIADAIGVLLPHDTTPPTTPSPPAASTQPTIYPAFPFTPFSTDILLISSDDVGFYVSRTLIKEFGFFADFEAASLLIGDAGDRPGDREEGKGAGVGKEEEAKRREMPSAGSKGLYVALMCVQAGSELPDLSELVSTRELLPSLLEATEIVDAYDVPSCARSIIALTRRHIDHSPFIAYVIAAILGDEPLAKEASAQTMPINIRELPASVAKQLQSRAPRYLEGLRELHALKSGALNGLEAAWAYCFQIARDPTRHFSEECKTSVCPEYLFSSRFIRLRTQAARQSMVALQRGSLDITAWGGVEDELDRTVKCDDCRRRLSLLFRRAWSRYRTKWAPKSIGWVSVPYLSR
ncbi:hypothetical protein IAT38_001627 [Cryptococcus sp. DSM 104549]